MPVHPTVLLHSSLPLFTAQLILEPLANVLTVLLSHRGRDVIDKVAEPLAQCHYPQAFTLSAPVEQGVER